MTLQITDTMMTSDQSAHTARQAADGRGWEVSWLPGQTLDRNSAITAMILAGTTAGRDLGEGRRLGPRIQGWAEEPGLTAPDAIARASRPASGINRQPEQASRQPGKEAAG
jgi:hypothetical protein